MVWNFRRFVNEEACPPAQQPAVSQIETERPRAIAAGVKAEIGWVTFAVQYKFNTSITIS